MQNTNITALLKTFSKREFNEFSAFVKSTVQIKKRDVRVYLKAIENFYPDFKADSINDEIIFRSIFPGKKFDKTKLSLAAFHLFDAACDFLVSLHMAENKMDASLYLLSQFMERNMRSSFLKLAGKLERKLKSSGYSLENYFLFRYKLDDILMTFHTRDHNYELLVKYYSEKTESVAALFVLKSMRLFMNRFFVKNSYAFEIKSDFLETMITNSDYDKLFSENEHGMYIEILRPIYCVYKGFSSDNSIFWIEKAESSFDKNEDMYSREEKVQISREILNLYYKMFEELQDQQNILNLQKKEFEFTKKLIEKDLCFSRKEKFFTPVMFRNTVMTAIELNELEWAENFIKSESEKLKPSLRLSMTNLCLAELEFKRKNFKKSLDYLGLVKYDSFFFRTDIKFLQMCIYYELKYFEQAIYDVESVRKYLKKGKDKTNDQTTYLNFLTYYSRLLKLNSKAGNSEAGKDLLELKKMSGKIEYYDWLVEKFSKL